MKVFIDTDCEAPSSFVRYANFLGGNDPHERLRRTSRTEIAGAVWSSLNSTTSPPFPKTTTGRIAVKVVKHRGEKVLKVYEVLPRAQ
jgi:adenine-specific DNA-methyltransferase